MTKIRKRVTPHAAGKLDEVVRPFGWIELVCQATESGQHEVGGDDGQTQRHQGLTEILTAKPVQDNALQNPAQGRCGESAGRGAGIPVAPCIAHEVADIPSEQVQSAIGKIHGPHQTEGQRETHGDQKVQRRGGCAVEQGQCECFHGLRLAAAERPAS